MEPVSLTLGAIVARLIARAADRTLDVTFAEGETKLRRLLDSVRARFSKERDQEALGTLELVEKAPDSERQIGELAKAIDKHAADEGFRTELQELIEQAKEGGVNVKRVFQDAIGDGNVQIADVSGGSEIKVDR